MYGMQHKVREGAEGFSARPHADENGANRTQAKDRCSSSVPLLHSLKVLHLVQNENVSSMPLGNEGSSKAGSPAPTIQTLLKQAEIGRDFGHDVRRIVNQMVHCVLQAGNCVEKTGPITSSMWEKATGECFAVSAAHYHLANAQALNALEQLEQIGICETWHFASQKTGIDAKMWKSFAGESFEVTKARQHFRKMQERATASNGSKDPLPVFLARKYASAAGVKTIKDLERILKITPVQWEQAALEPFKPLKGKWVRLLFSTPNGEVKPFRTFRLAQPIKIGPNSSLG